MSRGQPTQIEIDHYNQLVGKTVEKVEWEDFEGQPLAVLHFTDKSEAGVLCDPEGNGPGFLEIKNTSRFVIQTNDGRYVSQKGTVPTLVKHPSLAYTWATKEELHAIPNGSSHSLLERYALFFGASSPEHRRAGVLALAVVELPE